jgi:hypothetical protein
MPEQTIADDATIAGIAGSLNSPIKYVRNVLEQMWDCKRERGNASVRIGTMGEGRAPNYLIEYSRDSQQKLAVYGAYHGLGHKKMKNFDTSGLVRLEPIADRTLMRENWSSRAMTLDEDGVLLGKLRA